MDHGADGISQKGDGELTGEGVKRSRLRFLPYVIFAALAMWVAAEVFLINHDPEPGASSRTALEEQVVKAARSQDSDALNQLFAKGSVSDDYAKDYLDQLDEAEPGGLKASIRGRGGVDFLTLTGKSAKGEAICTAWQVDSEDGHWLLDATPPITPTPCGG
ncbi:hypothetical protein AB0I22_19980 [Streptomyces sp. NPDC050610]|uniref:hypothetical protein n=1 Tax=Streptomyces sp. NPDC050610 TaxID=3157097 RepID=UPI0034211237